jgi:hypothetical protein
MALLTCCTYWTTDTFSKRNVGSGWTQETTDPTCFLLETCKDKLLRRQQFVSEMIASVRSNAG